MYSAIVEASWGTTHSSEYCSKDVSIWFLLSLFRMVSKNYKGWDAPDGRETVIKMTIIYYSAPNFPKWSLHLRQTFLFVLCVCERLPLRQCRSFWKWQCWVRVLHGVSKEPSFSVLYTYFYPILVGFVLIIFATLISDLLWHSPKSLEQLFIYGT